jgi:WhiB family redox-sensing transcriptional regulator
MSWKNGAVCTPEQRHDFYPEGTMNTRRAKDQKAKSICSTGPVEADCLEYALLHEPYGTWGGRTEIEREQMRHSLGLPPLLPSRTHQKNSALRSLVWPDRLVQIP